MIETLEPKALWHHFADLNAVPRPSKKEERIIEFAKGFGEQLGLETTVDEVGNVIIKKPATSGMEGKPTVALQSHLDMVHQKNADTTFDFLTQGIQMFIEGDWVKAKGTTLGADNGIGVAAIMAILSAKDIPHPPIEALFTIDEETGMTGAMGLKGGLLKASIMLNLDTEDDDELTIGCAGGIDITATGNYKQSPVPEKTTAFKITVKGLTGGHSGMDIHIGRGNANKLLNRFLYQLSKGVNFSICEINGGGLRNAIPREAYSILHVPNAHLSTFEELVEEYKDLLKKEYKSTDPNVRFEAKPDNSKLPVIDPVFQSKLLRSIYACPNGIYRMSPDIKDLVQTSNNLARILVKEGTYKVLCLTRSSVDTEKRDEANSIISTFELIGAKVTTDGSYPGWAPKPSSKIVKLMAAIYQEMFDESPQVKACHAGLECGILGLNYPEMEMISFGPNIRGAHSPDERVQISSVQKFWKFLLTTLERIE